MTKFAQAEAVTLVYEGGKSDNPKDPGGRTNQGITQRTYDAYRSNHRLPTRDVYTITDAERDDIYLNEYWNPVGGDDLPVGIDLAVFDFAVNSGPGEAVKVLQRLVGVTDDGIMGAHTLDAVRQNDNHEELIDAYSDQRLAFMRTLKNWPDAKNGWTDRVKGVEDHATKLFLSSEQPDTHPVPAPPAGPTVPSDAQADQMPKAAPSSQQMAKTKPGIVGLIASASVVAPVVTGTADALKPYVGDSVIGQGVLVLVAALTIVGGIFTGYQLLKPYLKTA